MNLKSGIKKHLPHMALFNSPQEHLNYLNSLQNNNNMEDINITLNRIETCNNELEEFIKHVLSTKEGRNMSREEIRTIFFLNKIVKLEQSLGIIVKGM